MNNRLFAVGDIHGCSDAFQKLVENEIEIKKSDKLILLGDYIDRGFQSKEVVDYIIDLQHKGFDIVPLMGNHEAMLLDTIDNKEHISRWIWNGGNKTLESFGVNSLEDLDQLYKSFFKTLQYYYSFNDFLFVHAGFNDEIINPFSDKYQMIWARREKYLHGSLIDKTIVHGHTPITQTHCKEIIQSNSRVINIDTGCVYTDRIGYGYLSALELYSMKLFQISNSSFN